MPATIKIGGRELAVRPATVGFWLRCNEYTAKLDGMALADVIAGSVDLILEAVQDNEGATRAWLQDNLAFPPTQEYGLMLVAVGLAPAPSEKAAETPAGEAATQ